MLPAKLFVKSTTGIYRLSKSVTYERNPGAGHADEIALYDPAFYAKKNLARILAHEFAHRTYRQLSVEEARSYNSAAGWILVRTPRGIPIFVPGREDYVEEDGKEGPDEDFSNNIEYFLFSPDKLKSRTPKVYDWIRKKFGDKFKLTGALRK